MPKVSYPARGLAGRCASGETLLEAVRGIGHLLDHACGGNARCGTCCVKVVEGEGNLTPVGPEEEAILGELGLSAPHRLSCQAKVLDDVVVNLAD